MHHLVIEIRGMSWAGRSIKSLEIWMDLSEDLASVLTYRGGYFSYKKLKV